MFSAGSDRSSHEVREKSSVQGREENGWGKIWKTFEPIFIYEVLSKVIWKFINILKILQKVNINQH